ncbi:hypothetical protein CVM73_18875 [Bradyrhizobium forestalis]|uniref:Uncharacterized protein n=1 Tax=Bradyrhizobium forestalis TaxID=1419263 RepID=A0A2M8R7I3_9BRAD|nr:hypothetical protein [Bradyrhizobium forestalis]PJG53785.1 hypothetical protein CVM73_18875 [Bradyrhizobium forestalis]
MAFAVDWQATEKTVVDKLLKTLQELPAADAHLQSGQRSFSNARSRIDAEIDLRISNQNLTLLVEAKKSLFPRDAREALWQLREYASQFGGGDHVIPLLAAESISPGSKEFLRRENVGYFEMGGSLFIPAPGAYVLIDKPVPRNLARSVSTVFKGKRSQVLRVLDPQHWFSVKALSEAARVSPATASETLIMLERFEWLAARGQDPSKERQLTAPRALLDEWKKQVLAGIKPKTRRYYVPNATNEDTFIGRMDTAFAEAGVEYVLTQESAGRRYAPFLSSLSRVSCRGASTRSAGNALSRLGAREVSEGANFTMIETLAEEGPFLFEERHGAAWLASPVQVYLDLLIAGGRAQEAAEHLRKERISF